MNMGLNMTRLPYPQETLSDIFIVSKEEPKNNLEERREKMTCRTSLKKHIAKWQIKRSTVEFLIAHLTICFESHADEDK